VVAPILRQFGVSVDAPRAAYAHYRGVAAIDRDVPGTGVAYLGEYASAAGVRPDDLEAARGALGDLWSRPSLELWRQPVEGAFDYLLGLGASRHRLGIVSNSDGTVEAQLRARGLCQVGPGSGGPVEVIADSYKVGHAKPAPELFYWALDAMRVRPEEAVYIGDSYRIDVRGAKSAGLQALHVDPEHLCELNDHVHLRLLGKVLEAVDAIMCDQ
jgi:FMN phosphatase YigB (HAD superfamily)